jgi:hypothetical protein
VTEEGDRAGRPKDDDPPGDATPDDPAEEEVPPAKIVTIEDLADEPSPYLSLNGSSLDEPDAVALFRVAAPIVTNRDGDAAFVGELLASVAKVLEGLGAEHGAVRLKRLEFHNSFDVLLTSSSAEVGRDRPLDGMSKERGAAERLKAILASRDEDALFAAVPRESDDLAVPLEGMLKLLVQTHAVLDYQTPQTRPVRIGYERAEAIYTTLLRSASPAPRHITLPGELIGAIIDTRDFKIRLAQAWENHRKIDGKFVAGLEETVAEFFQQPVMAGIRIDAEQHGIRSPKLHFTLDELRAPAQLSSLPFDT